MPFDSYIDYVDRQKLSLRVRENIAVPLYGGIAIPAKNVGVPIPNLSFEAFGGANIKNEKFGFSLTRPQEVSLLPHSPIGRPIQRPAQVFNIISARSTVSRRVSAQPMSWIISPTIIP
jgi:hypothetical protein